MSTVLSYLRAALNWSTLLALFFISLPSLLGLYHGDQGRFIGASAALIDSHFKGQVVYMFDQSWHRARGLVVGQPYPDSSQLPLFLKKADIPVYWGGPVEDRDTIHVVRIKDKDQLPEVRPWDEMVREIPNILEDVRRYPDTYKVFVGYAGWGFGDFEAERGEKSWFVAPYDSRLWSDDLNSVERLRRVTENSLDKKHPVISSRQKS